MNAKESVFIQDLAAAVRPLNDVVDNLRAIGLQKMVDIPTIAVVGEQSTGLIHFHHFHP